MSEIGPGDLLLCVDASGWLGRLVEGRVYECRRLIESDVPLCPRCGDVHTSCIDVGIMPVKTGFYNDWPAVCRFVPAGHRGDFRALLTVIDAPADLQGVDA